MVILRRIGRERQGCDEFGEKEPGAQPGVNLHGGLAIPAHSRLGGKVAFQDGPGIDVGPLHSTHLLHGEVEISQLLLNDVVVVVVPGVAGDAVGRVGLLRSRIVIESQANHGLCTGQDFPRVGPALGIAFQPGHVTGLARRNPLQELIGVAGTVGGGHPAVVEPELGSDELHVAFGER